MSLSRIQTTKVIFFFNLSIKTLRYSKIKTMKIFPIDVKMAIFSLAFIFLFSSCTKKTQTELNPNGTLRIQFKFEANGKALKLFDNYKNSLGQSYRVENLMMYLSNFVLVGENGNFTEKDSYHFVAVSRESSEVSFVLKNIPQGKYTKLNFALGVDSLRNSSTQKIGDLDANSNMGWPWTQGYKFISFEGRHFVENQNEGTELVYHIGENKNYKRITLALKNGSETSFLVDETEKVLIIKVNVDKMFNAVQPIDFLQISTVMAGQNAVIMANNMEKMFELP